MKANTLAHASHIAENDVVICCLIENDTFMAYHKPKSLATKEDLKFLFNHYETLATDGPLRVIVEMAPLSTMDKEARDFLQNHKIEAVCEAVVLNSLAQRIIVNFYFKFKKHQHPSRAFSSFEKARKWANSIEQKTLIEEH